MLWFLNGAIAFIIWVERKDQPGLDLHNSQQYLIDFVANSETFLASSIQVYETAQVF